MHALLLIRGSATSLQNIVAGLDVVDVNPVSNALSPENYPRSK